MQKVVDISPTNMPYNVYQMMKLMNIHVIHATTNTLQFQTIRINAAVSKYLTLTIAVKI